MSVILPYNMATLCYLFDEHGRVLLLHRKRPPNRDLYSPIGGKLDRDHGESPTACALREIHEEADIQLKPHEIHLTGIITEEGFEDQMHWMMFLYEVTRPVAIERMQFDEGTLEWFTFDEIEKLPIPQTDQRVIWPLFKRFRGSFFAAHLQCHHNQVRWRLEQPCQEATDWSDQPATA